MALRRIAALAAAIFLLVPATASTKHAAGRSEDIARIEALKPAILAKIPGSAVRGYGNFLDLSNSGDYAYVIAQLNAAGINLTEFPTLFSALDVNQALYQKADNAGVNLPQAMSAGVGPQLQPANVMTNSPQQNLFTVSVMTTVPGIPAASANPYAVANTVGIYATSGLIVGGPGGGVAIGVPETLTTQASSGMPPTPKSYDADGVFLYVYPASVLGPSVMQQLGLSADDPVAVAGVADANFEENDGTTTIVNQAPVDVNGYGYINICIGRTSSPNGNSDCDYSYPSNSDGSFTLQIPLQGNVTFPTAIKTDANGKPAGAQYTVGFAFPQSGGSCNMNNDTFGDLVHVNNNVLSWNISDAQFGQLYPNTPCGLTYGSTSFPVFQVSMDILNVNDGWMPALITSATGAGGANTLPIPAVEVTFGCLRAGTMIAMADGTRRAIETLQHGDKIRSGHGMLTVANYLVGPETDPLYGVTTANGFRVEMTAQHAVPTRKGIKLARKLKVGDVVTTLKGPSRIARIQRIAYDGKVWNLDVGVPGEAARQNPDRETFFAGGVLVGDSRMQVKYSVADRDSRASVLARLPKSWRKDYASAQKRKRRLAGIAHRF
jgi:hypothetical protein